MKQMHQVLSRFKSLDVHRILCKYWFGSDQWCKWGHPILSRISINVVFDGKYRTGAGQCSQWVFIKNPKESQKSQRKIKLEFKVNIDIVLINEANEGTKF